MLNEHEDEVRELLLRKKNEYDQEEEQEEEESHFANAKQSGLRSPPLPSGTTSRLSAEPRYGSVPLSERTPKLPPIGYFNVSNSPKSPLKKSF